jgi:hypothetical protein
VAIGDILQADRKVEHPARRRAASGQVLDRIDQIVPPGANVNPADGGQTPALEAAARRR